MLSEASFTYLLEHLELLKRFYVDEKPSDFSNLQDLSKFYTKKHSSSCKDDKDPSNNLYGMLREIWRRLQQLQL